MAENSFPFDAGAGSSITEDSWTKMARLWVPSGVIRGEMLGLEPFADGSGMNVKHRTGRGIIEGHYYENDAEKTLAIGANTSGATRLDRLVVRLDKTANAITSIIIPGVTANTLPALVRTTTVWDEPLAQITVANAAASIVADNVQDHRHWSNPSGGLLDYKENNSNSVVNQIAASTNNAVWINATGLANLNFWTPGNRRVRIQGAIRMRDSIVDEEVYISMWDQADAIRATNSILLRPASRILTGFLLGWYVPAAGYHTLRWRMYRAGTGAVDKFEDGAQGTQYSVEDIGGI